MKTLRAMGISVLIGLIGYALVSLIFIPAESRSVVFGSLCLCAIIGLLSRVYDTELPALIATLIHIGGSLLVFLLLAYIGHWFPFEWGIILLNVGVFLVIFMLIWSGFYYHEKKQMDMINQRLKAK